MKKLTFIDITDFYNEILNFIGSEKFVKMLNSTVFANDSTLRNAVIHGLLMTPAITENIQHYTVATVANKSTNDSVFSINNMNWIKCNDKLPSNTDMVLVTIKDESSDYPYYYLTVGSYHQDKDIWIVDNDISTQVFAWLPFPKPFTE